jgi:outer membrane protein assembly factor BamB
MSATRFHGSQNRLITNFISHFSSYLRRRNLKRKLTVTFIVILCLSLFPVFALKVNAQQSSGGWPMFRGDLSHSGVGTGSPVLTPKLLWKYTTGSAAKSHPTEYTDGGAVESSPAVVDGVVYVGCDDTSIYALNAVNGHLIWGGKGGSGDPIISSPSVVDGVVYYGGSGQLVGLTVKGVVVIDATSTANLYGSLVNSSPAVLNGTIYYGASDGGVWALNISLAGFGRGAQFVWSNPIKAQFNSSPAVVNGVLYIGAEDTYVNQTSVEGVGEINAANGVYALNATNGEQLWNFTDGGYSVDSSPAVVNGVVYVGSYDDNVYALNAANGAKLWNYTTGAYVDSSPAVFNGIVYISSHDGYFYALNATSGMKLWSVFTGGGRSSSAVVGGVIYVGGGNSIYALSSSDGGFLWRCTTGGEVESSPAVVNGVVYVGSDDGNVYAFGTIPASSHILFIVIGAVVVAVIVVVAAVLLMFRKRLKTKATAQVFK